MSHKAAIIKSLLDEAFRVLQHDSDEDQPEYAHLRDALGKSFWRVLKNTSIAQPSAVVLDDSASEIVEKLRRHHAQEIHDWDVYLEAADLIEQQARATSLRPVAQPVEQTRALTVTPAMVKAAMPWLTSLHHMRKTDKESYVEEAIKAAMTAARPASGETE